MSDIIETEVHELILSTDINKELSVLLDDSLKRKMELLYFEYLRKMQEEISKSLGVKSEYLGENLEYGSDREGNKSKGWCIKTDCP